MNSLEREKIREGLLRSKKLKDQLKLELIHVLGRLLAGTGVLLIGKYILNIWG